MVSILFLRMSVFLQYSRLLTELVMLSIVCAAKKIFCGSINDGARLCETYSPTARNF